MGLVRPSSLDKAGASSLANRALSLAVDFDFDVAMIFCFYLLPRFRSDYRFVGCSIWLGKPRHVIVWLLILVTYPGYLSWLPILVTCLTSRRNGGRFSPACRLPSCVQCGSARSSGKPPSRWRWQCVIPARQFHPSRSCAGLDARSFSPSSRAPPAASCRRGIHAIRVPVCLRPAR